jgi:deoxyhypusine synthase
MHPTSPVDVKLRTVGELTEAMLNVGFQGRKLAEAVEVWTRMVKDNVTIFMGLSGAMVPAGMRKLIAFLIQHKLIGCLVSTGANIFHDCHEALGNSHYVGTHKVNDVELCKLGIDRIYDIFAYEQKFEATDWLINDFAMTLPAKSYSSAEFMKLLGEHVEKVGGASDSIIVSAYKHDVPLFVPALCDSSIGLSLYLVKLSGKDVLIDHIEDICQITDIVRGSESSGVIYVGGGVPKNFIQQTAMAIKIASGGDEDYGHNYAIQFTTDSPQWGGLSGCTLEEAVSWGKVRERAQKVQVFVDATIALPIVVHAVAENLGLSKDV